MLNLSPIQCWSHESFSKHNQFKTKTFIDTVVHYLYTLDLDILQHVSSSLQEFHSWESFLYFIHFTGTSYAYDEKRLKIIETGLFMKFTVFLTAHPHHLAKASELWWLAVMQISMMESKCSTEELWKPQPHHITSATRQKLCKHFLSSVMYSWLSRPIEHKLKIIIQKLATKAVTNQSIMPK